MSVDGVGGGLATGWQQSRATQNRGSAEGAGSSFDAELASTSATPASPGDVAQAPASSSPSASLSMSTVLQLQAPTGALPSASAGGYIANLIGNFARNLDPAKEAAAESQFLQTLGAASFKSADVNKDGTVTQSEWTQMMSRPNGLTPATPAQLNALWDKMDPTNSGSLDEQQYIAGIIAIQ